MGGAEGLGLEEVAEDGIVEQCLALAYAEAHGVDQHAVVECSRGVAREEEVVEWLGVIAVEAHTVPFRVVEAFYQRTCKLLTGHVGQAVCQVGIAIHTSLYHAVAEGIVVHQPAHDVVDVVHVAPLLQHFGKEGMLLCGEGLTENIVVECFVGHVRVHPLYFKTRTTQQHGTKMPCLRTYIDRTGA